MAQRISTREAREMKSDSVGLELVIAVSSSEV
jgi:hypothetical protein